LLTLATGCATPKIDWSSRVGTYTYDQAVLEFGPPDKYAKLTDGSLVVEWLTRRGYTYTYSPMGYGYWYGPFYPGPAYYMDTFNSPDCFLRLTFDPAGHLKAWKRFYR
jgi:hypothetical protein